MDISARAFSLADRPQRAIRVTSVRMRREDRSSISTYSSRRPRLETVDSDYVIACSSYRAVPLFEPRAVPSSRPAERRSRRAQGRSRPAVALGLRRAPALPGCALTAPSTARGSSGSDACIVSPRQLEGAPFSQHCPGDAGKLVGERDRQHVVVQPPLGGFDPGFEPIPFPVLDPDQHNPCRLHEQNAQVAIAAPRDFAEDGAVSGRDLLGHQSEPGAEVAAFGEYVASADRRHHGARNDRPDARHRHQARTCLILTGQGFDLAGEAIDALIQPAPVACQLLDDTQHAWRQGIGARRKDGGQFRAQEADTWRTAIPRSSMKARIWLMMPVRCDTSRSRTRCSACRSSCAAVLVATNFIVGRCTASAIASASLKSFFCPLL